MRPSQTPIPDRSTLPRPLAAVRHRAPDRPARLDTTSSSSRGSGSQAANSPERARRNSRDSTLDDIRSRPFRIGQILSTRLARLRSTDLYNPTPFRSDSPPSNRRNPSASLPTTSRQVRHHQRRQQPTPPHPSRSAHHPPPSTPFVLPPLNHASSSLSRNTVSSTGTSTGNHVPTAPTAVSHPLTSLPRQSDHLSETILEALERSERETIEALQALVGRPIEVDTSNLEPAKRSFFSRLPFSSFPTFLASSRSRSRQCSKLCDNSRQEDWEITQPFLEGQADEMSFLNCGNAWLNMKLDVVFDNEGQVDMLGNANTGYSLPGHVLITLPALSRSSHARRSVRELRELKLDVEGMSEYFDPAHRYTPLRTFKTTLTIIDPSQPVRVTSHDPARPYESRLTLAVPFDLRLPGWLPPSHAARMTNIGYGAIASATIGWADLVGTNTRGSAPPTLSAGSSSGSSHSSSVAIGDLLASDTLLKLADRSRKATKIGKMSFEHLFASNTLSLSTKATSTAKNRYAPFNIRRHRFPGAMYPSSVSYVTRSITVRPAIEAKSPVEVVMTLPEWIDLHGDVRSIKLALRVKANDAVYKARREAGEVTAAARAIRGISVESYNAESAMGEAGPSMPGAYTGGMSNASEEAPQGETEEDDFMTYITELGMEVEEIERYSSIPTESYRQYYPLPDDQPDRDNTVNPLIAPRSPWADLLMPGEHDPQPFRCSVVRSCLLSEDGSQRNFMFEDKGLALRDKWRKVNVVLPMNVAQTELSRKPKSELESPFLRVRHLLRLRIVCRSYVPGVMDQTIDVRVPIRFGTMPSTLPGASRNPRLPPYIQLFYENGEQRQCDPLPLYTVNPYEEEPPSFSPQLEASLPSINSISSIAAPKPVIERDITPEPGSSVTTDPNAHRASSPAESLEDSELGEDDILESEASDEEESAEEGEEEEEETEEASGSEDEMDTDSVSSGSTDDDRRSVDSEISDMASSLAAIRSDLGHLQVPPIQQQESLSDSIFNSHRLPSPWSQPGMPMISSDGDLSLSSSSSTSSLPSTSSYSSRSGSVLGAALSIDTARGLERAVGVPPSPRTPGGRKVRLSNRPIRPATRE